MIRDLPIKQRQIVAVFLLLVVLLLLFMFLVGPFLTRYLSYGESIDSLEQQKITYQRLAQGIDQTEQELQQLKQNNPSATFYLPESKPALAAARLQQYLNEVIRSSGGQVVSTQILKRTNDSPLQGIAIQVRLRVEMEQLVPLLHRIESGEPLLFIENFAVTANVRRQSSRQQRLQQQRLQRQQRLQQQRNSNQANRRVNQARPMDVRFDLIGYAPKEPAS